MNIALNDGINLEINDTIYVITPRIKQNSKGRLYVTKKDTEVVIVKMLVLRIEVQMIYTGIIVWKCNGLTELAEGNSDDEYVYLDAAAYEYNSYSSYEAAKSAFKEFTVRGYNDIRRHSRGEQL